MPSSMQMRMNHIQSQASRHSANAVATQNRMSAQLWVSQQRQSQRNQHNRQRQSQFLERSNRSMQFQGQKANRFLEGKPLQVPKVPQQYLNSSSDKRLQRELTTGDKVGLGFGLFGLSPGLLGAASNTVSGVGVAQHYGRMIDRGMRSTRGVGASRLLRDYGGKSTRGLFRRRRSR